MSLTATERIREIDSELSKRHLDLDPGGYFIIYIDRGRDLICVKHFTNAIDSRGLAIDPDTGKPIPARGKVERQTNTEFQGTTAKQLCVEIFERAQPDFVTMLNHAAYLGRELQRAESALINNQEYIQD